VKRFLTGSVVERQRSDLSHCQKKPRLSITQARRKKKEDPHISHIKQLQAIPTSKLKMTEMKRVLIFGGKTGWIGGLMDELIKTKDGE
jgi:hypothetical protein